MYDLLQVGVKYGNFQRDELDIPEIPNTTQQVGPAKENIELCSSMEKVKKLILKIPSHLKVSRVSLKTHTVYSITYNVVNYSI